MIELWMVLTPILLADIVNPVLFAFLVYAAGTGRPVANSSALLLGHTAAYFIVGTTEQKEGGDPGRSRVRG